jgi:UDPglucose 6-dehydrogenase
VDLARKVGYTFELMEATLSANDRVKARMIEKVEGLCGSVKGKRVALLGIAFKPETDDIRESASLKLAADLLARGADVVAYDPAAMENARKEMPQLKLAEDQYACIAGADILVLATDWNQFRKLDLPRIEKTMKAKNFVDLRNLYEPKDMKKAGWNYVGLGRA